jgi:zinc transporter ZupT
MEHPISVWPIIILALIHFFGSRLSFLGGIPRSIWLSIAGGVSVAYIFLHLFPELSEGQRHVQELDAFKFLKHRIYLIALIGLAVFYGLERAVMSSKEDNDNNKVDPGVFWLHIGSFAIYNALIGYLLYQREDEPFQEMVLFSIAMALHFIVNDYGLQAHHKDDYRMYGRWVLVTALVSGWLTGLVFPLSEAIIMMAMAFVGGGVILNVMKEELPEKHKSRYWAFLIGAGAYSVLLLLL